MLSHRRSTTVSLETYPLYPCVYNTPYREPLLCFTDTAWGKRSATSSRILQRLQNRAARIVLKLDSS